MSADKRSVHTDALSTLGKIIGAEEKRDAIHLAVEPVIAGHPLIPGQEIGIKYVDNQPTAYSSGVKLTGIVDPFLKVPVVTGERCWMILFPRQIASLRHVWSHPDFREPVVADDRSNEIADLKQALLDAANQISDLRSEITETNLEDECRGCY